MHLLSLYSTDLPLYPLWCAAQTDTMFNIKHKLYIIWKFILLYIYPIPSYNNLCCMYKYNNIIIWKLKKEYRYIGILNSRVSWWEGWGTNLFKR